VKALPNLIPAIPAKVDMPQRFHHQGDPPQGKAMFPIIQLPNHKKHLRVLPGIAVAESNEAHPKNTPL